tara:strand:- start:49 stop:543 length:495 start_codon:yes stop_codon:yes gene_type:complete
MIITCINCNKKFDINSELIPEKGRLLECGSCKHKWFFKKDLSNDTYKSDKIENITKIEEITVKNEDNDLSDTQLFNDIETPVNNVEEENEVKNEEVYPDDIKKEKKGINFLNIIIVFIISFIALIVLIDTFKYPISKIIPNVEFLLYNLYESIKDIILFFKDLI